MRPIHALSLLVAASLKLLTPMIALAQAPAPHEHDLGELGSVDIATSCSAEANAHVQRGLALLHHMMYERAAKAFAAAAAVQPACAMAYWGQAMSFVHPIWSDPPSAAAFAKGALLADTALAEGAKTSRERAYIEAIQRYYRASQTNKEAVNLRAFAGGWAAVHELYPDDPDAALFYALAQLATADPTDKTFAQQRRAGELIERVFARYPNHPGAHHYFIHAYDYPPLAARALQVARDYGRIAPEVPHALHMPSHIFTRLGLWEDSIAWNERSAAAALESPVGSVVSLHYLHALDYLAYAHLQRAEDEKAAQILAKLQRLQPPVQPELASAYALAAVPARIALERQDWAAAMALAPRSPEWFAWSSFPAVEAITHFARALGAAHRRNVSLARQSLDTLAALRDRAAESNAYWGTQVEIQRLAALAWLTFEQGERRQGIETMRQAAQLEASTEKHPVTPGEVLPASELLADMLLEMGEHAAARKQYAATLERSPNRFNSSYGVGRAAELAGDEAAAIKSYRQLVAFAVTDGKARTDRLQHAARYLASRQLAPRASAPRPGWSPDLALEGAIECCFGSKADGGGNVGDAHALTVEQTGGDLQPPLAQVLDRGHSHELGEPLREGGARQAGLTAQRVERPGLCRPPVYRAQRCTDMAIAQAGEPAGRLIRQAVDVLAHRVQEHQLAALREDRLAAGARLLAFFERAAHQIERENAGGTRPSDLQYARQCFQHRVVRSRVAAEKAADEARLLPVAAELVQNEWQRIARRAPIQAGVRHCVGAGLGADRVTIAAGDDYGIADVEAHRGLRLVDELRPASAVEHHMKADDVLELRHHAGADAG
jgi:hypothetical protein